MAYYLELLTPENYETFVTTGRDKIGFPMSDQEEVRQILPGAKVISHMRGLARWVGVLEVTSNMYVDDSPLYFAEDDPFVLRFNVRPIAWLSVEKAIPIDETVVWNTLRFTRDLQKNSTDLVARLLESFTKLSDEDGRFLEELIINQLQDGAVYPFDELDYQKHFSAQPDGVGSVWMAAGAPIPEAALAQDEVTTQVSDSPEPETSPVPETPVAQETVDLSALTDEAIDRPTVVSSDERTEIQALLAHLGEKMGFEIWIPYDDRSAVSSRWAPASNCLLDELLLNFNERSLSTIETLDVLWLKGTAIARAFVLDNNNPCHGLLRMADLFTLQPNMQINLHIVAPESQRSSVCAQIRRPIFSSLERGPLAEHCTLIPYDRVRELCQDEDVAHLSDSVFEVYAEKVD